jgi:hypothetical protein
MANTPVVVLDDTLTDIADAIRAKTGGSATMTPGQMPAQIASIPSGGGGVGIPREVDTNGVYNFPAQNFSFSLPSGATTVGARTLSSAFYGCTSLTSVDLSSLTTVSGSNALNGAFRSCTSLASVSFPALTTVSGTSALYYAFSGCTSLTSVSFPALTTSSFGSRTNQFSNMLQGVTGCTVHFPAAIRSTIGSWSDVTNGFGGTNTTVLFDL